jgi:hypothetical protein
MQLINLCPDPIKVQRMPGANDGSVTIFKSMASAYGITLTVSDEPGAPEYIDNIVVTPVIISTSAKLPEPQMDVAYIVPKDVAMAYVSTGRQDLLFPDYPDAVNLPQGKYPTYLGLYRYK